jgi:hypothetical protein
LRFLPADQLGEIVTSGFPTQFTRHGASGLRENALTLSIAEVRHSVGPLLDERQLAAGWSRHELLTFHQQSEFADPVAAHAPQSHGMQTPGDH